MHPDDGGSGERHILASYLDQARQRMHVPGIVCGFSGETGALVLASGKSDLRRNWDMPQTARFGIACLTKFLVAFLALRLHQSGVLDLDAPVQRYLEEFPRREGCELTLRHLLSHTAGYQGPAMLGVDYRKWDWRLFMDYYAAAPQIFRPGAVFNYENTGHAIVGEAIGRTVGRPLDLLQDLVFGPVGITYGSAMKDYSATDAWCGAHQLDAQGKLQPKMAMPASAFWQSSLADITLSIGDMLAIGQALMDGRLGCSLEDLHACLQKRVVSTGLMVSSEFCEHVPRHFSSLWAEYGDGWYGYAGSAPGQTVALRLHLKRKAVSAVGMNLWAPVARDHIMDILCKSRNHPRAGQSQVFNVFAEHDFGGQYLGGGNIFGNITVILETGKIRMKVNNAAMFPAEILAMMEDDRTVAVSAQAIHQPPLGFFVEAGIPCVRIGPAAFRRVN
jgi:CubicO group peptidase (beta-lactamase class C family)